MGALDWLTSLFNSSPPPGKTYSAPPLAGYPTEGDVALARKSGFGYGTALEPYINQRLVRVLAEQAPTVPGEGRWSGRGTAPGSWRTTSSADYPNREVSTSVNRGRTGLFDPSSPGGPPMVDAVGDRWAKAALAANRIPLAALGMDPGRTAIDVLSPGMPFGLYNPRGDNIYSNLAGGTMGDSLVHESIHRGIQKLREGGAPEVLAAIQNLPDEEYIVRYLMRTQAGDPEDLPSEQKMIQDAMSDWAMNQKNHEEALDVLNRNAQQMIARRQPMGPR